MNTSNALRDVITQLNALANWTEGNRNRKYWPIDEVESITRELRSIAVQIKALDEKQRRRLGA
jgi:hypothetical protein